MNDSSVDIHYNSTLVYVVCFNRTHTIRERLSEVQSGRHAIYGTYGVTQGKYMFAMFVSSA